MADDPVERAARKAVEEIHRAVYGLHPDYYQRAIGLLRDHLDKMFFSAPPEVAGINNEWLLRCYDLAREHNKNLTKAEFVRLVTRINGANPDIPPSQRRGAAGTDDELLYRHLNVLLAKREKESE